MDAKHGARSEVQLSSSLGRVYVPEALHCPGTYRRSGTRWYSRYRHLEEVKWRGLLMPHFIFPSVA